jgi:hypothetical protein
MSNQYVISNPMTKFCIDVQEKNGTPKAETLLDIYPQRTNKPNQLWEFQPDPSGYYVIVSALGNLVMDVQEKNGTPKPETLLDVYPLQSGKHNQLWKIVPYTYNGQLQVDGLPTNQNSFNIQSALGDLVVDIQEKNGPPKAETLLDVFPLQPGKGNQLWTITAPTFYKYNPTVTLLNPNDVHLSGNTLTVAFIANGFFPGGGVMCEYTITNENVDTNAQGPPVYTADFGGVVAASFAIDASLGFGGASLSVTLTDTYNGLSASIANNWVIAANGSFYQS